MPVRSSVCTYSPLKMSTPTSKYISSVPSSLSVGNYKSLASPTTTNHYSPTSSYSSNNSLNINGLYSNHGLSSRTAFSTLSSPTKDSYRTYNQTTFDESRFNNTRNAYSRYSSGRSSLSASASSNYSGRLDKDSTPSYLQRSSFATHRSSFLGPRGLSSYNSSTDGETEALPPGVPQGLVNLGNTCYMNATLQSLYSLELFRNYILETSRDKVLCTELSDLFKEIKNSSTSVSPANFKYAFSRYQSKFSGLGQQDAQEFLRYLINGIQEECNLASKRTRRSAPPRSPTSADEAWYQYKEIVDDSPLVDMLVGQLCSTICCSVCQNKSNCWDPFWDLSLPLMRGKYSCKLSEIIDDFTAKETLDSDERPICSRCKCTTRSTKQISFHRLPKLLILHLKRFSNDGYKLTNPDVKIDKQLSINGRTYQLQACISHHGHSSSSGHYTSLCKYLSKWFHFNDDRVRDVTSTFDGDKLGEAYVLFYSQQSESSVSRTTFGHSRL